MPHPIKATPVLTGKDATRFLRKLEENKKKKVSQERMDEIIKTYKEFMAIFVKEEEDPFA